MSILKEIAEQLNGSEYPLEPSKDIQQCAKENGIVIVFGASDDLMELRGAIYDEGSCYDGGTFVLDKGGFIPISTEGEFEDDQHPQTVGEARALCDRFDNSIHVTAIWNPQDIEGLEASWAYGVAGPTPLEYESFLVMEDGDVYCRGLVFKLP